ncbi:MAG: tRNA pseudouridine(38-40) synthase TruA [Alphaproteobacteria bacterium]|nr:tRNA pseudouridine(38-40) synthase TruA [Alphaproteobacteria bacterium]
MPRYRLDLEYDGRPFAGWQRQPDVPTVQTAVEAAICRMTGETVTLTAAGRTDAGVHALGQVAHFDLARPFLVAKLADALNFYLRPAPVAVLAAAEVAADFHARFQATSRCYRYRILNRRAPPTLARGLVWHVAQPLDATAMARSAQGLVGRHDFTTFRDADCQAASPVKTLAALGVERRGEEVWIEARARSFLHRQVRSMVGSLKRVGEGAWPEAAIAEVLAAQDRARCGPVAPAEGLCLLAVSYE